MSEFKTADELLQSLAKDQDIAIEEEAVAASIKAEEEIATESESTEKEEEEKEEEEEESEEEKSEEEETKEEEEEESVTVEPEKEETVVNEETQSDKDDDPDLISDWDEDEADSKSGDVDITSVLSDIGIEADNAETARTYIQELKEKVTTLEEANSGNDNLPNELVEAIEVHKDGGNYLEYLKITSVDYSIIDPVDLWMHDKSQYFLDPATKQIDEERLNAYAEKIGEDQIRIEGSQLKDRMQNQRTDKEKAFRQATIDRKTKNEADLKEVMSKIDSISNYKLTPNHKQTLLNGILTGKMMKDMFFNTDGSYDYPKMIDNYFKSKYFDKVKGRDVKRAASEAKKQIIKTTTNAKIKPSSAKPVIVKKQELSGLDILMGQLKEDDKNRLRV